MEKKRPKARGIEEIAHFFFSSNSSPYQHSKATSSGTSSAKVFPLISLVEDLPTPFLTSNLAIELAYRQKRVLIADTFPKAVNIFYALGLNRQLATLEPLWKNGQPELVITGPLGIRILNFPLEPNRIALLRSLRSGSLFRALGREECSHDVFLVNLYPPETHRNGTSQSGNGEGPPSGALKNSAGILSVARELILLLPSDFTGIKRSYGFLKSIYHLHPKISAGILFLSSDTDKEGEAGIHLLRDMVAKFLGKRLKVYGQLISNNRLFLSVLQGKPLCREVGEDPNKRVLTDLAVKLVENLSEENSLPHLLKGENTQLLLEAVNSVTEPDPPDFDLACSLNRDESFFLDQRAGSV
jgi:hypothetical protein